jgi:hypothetical protein
MVCMRFTQSCAHSATRTALPGIPQEDGQPPRTVCLVAIPTGCCVWPGRLVSLCTGRSQTQRPVGGNAMWHQLFSETMPIVPVLLVVAETSLA